jgi:hypothetical protein
VTLGRPGPRLGSGAFPAVDFRGLTDLTAAVAVFAGVAAVLDPVAMDGGLADAVAAEVVVDEVVDFWPTPGSADDVLAMRSKVAARSDELKHVFERHAAHFWFLSDLAGRHSLRRSIECPFDQRDQFSARSSSL